MSLLITASLANATSQAEFLLQNISLPKTYAKSFRSPLLCMSTARSYVGFVELVESAFCRPYFFVSLECASDEGVGRHDNFL